MRRSHFAVQTELTGHNRSPHGTVSPATQALPTRNATAMIARTGLGYHRSRSVRANKESGDYGAIARYPAHAPWATYSIPGRGPDPSALRENNRARVDPTFAAFFFGFCRRGIARGSTRASHACSRASSLRSHSPPRSLTSQITLSVALPFIFRVNAPFAGWTFSTATPTEPQVHVSVRRASHSEIRTQVR